MKTDLEGVFIVMAGAALGAIIYLILSPILLTPINNAINGVTTPTA